MAVRFAVFTILSIAICFLAINVGRDPKRWRLLWLDFLSILDVDTSREQKKAQERQLAFMAYFLFVVFFTSAFSCGFWTVDQIRETQRYKTTPERDAAFNRKMVEKVDRYPSRTRRPKSN